MCVGVLCVRRPNAAFDLCGLCCGAFRMPFWQFFGATLIGKATVKVNGQVRHTHTNTGTHTRARACVPTQTQVQPWSGEQGRLLRVWLACVVWLHLAQALFFVALFRRATRERVLAWIGDMLPTHIPGLHLSRTPAQELRAFIDRSIQKFQVRCAAQTSHTAPLPRRNSAALRESSTLRGVKCTCVCVRAGQGCC